MTSPLSLQALLLYYYCYYYYYYYHYYLLKRIEDNQESPLRFEEWDFDVETAEAAIY